MRRELDTSINITTSEKKITAPLDVWLKHLLKLLPDELVAAVVHNVEKEMEEWKLNEDAPE